MTDTATLKHTSPPFAEAFKQPRPVWAIAFATTVSFMGIGLVDPILPAIAHELHATASQAMLLFTSYLLITACAMFFTAYVSSRIGTRKTLLIGLALVVVFAAACSASGSVQQIIGWRAGWGLGNALFISTALSAIVGAASGGPAGAIILYEAALGIGMAVGPLAGGLLGHVSWRGPFAGTAVLMGIAFLGITLLFTQTPQPASDKVAFTAGLRALKEPALRTLSISALFYNMAFFILLAYSPFPLEAAAHARGMTFGELELGLVFFGWGVGLAITSVGAAPILTRRVGQVPTIIGSLVLMGVIMITLAVAHGSLPVIIGCVVASGLVFGVINTALTEAVMEATSLQRRIASSSYSGIRFLGGAIASAAAGPLAAATSPAAPYLAATVCAVLAIVVLALGRRHLHTLTRRLHLTAEQEAEAIGA